jgi:hypothetical protein
VETKEFERSLGYSMKTKDAEAVRVSFNHRGEVTQVHNLEALNTRSIGGISFDRILREYLPALPDKDMAVGETWEDSISARIPLQELDLEVSTNREYVLLDVIPAEDGDVAAISITYTVKLSGSKNWEDWTGTFEGQGGGTGSLLFNIRRGCIRQFNVEYGTKGALVIRKKNESVQEYPFNLSIEASIIQIR